MNPKLTKRVELLEESIPQDKGDERQRIAELEERMKKTIGIKERKQDGTK